MCEQTWALTFYYYLYKGSQHGGQSYKKQEEQKMLRIYYTKNVNRENEKEFERYWEMTNPRINEQQPKPRKDEYEMKGEFENIQPVNGPNKIYQMCQNGIGDFEKPFEGRSMMVGDLVEIDGQLYICAPVGFHKTSWE